MGNGLVRVLSHPVFLSGFLSWFCAQVIKLLVEALKRRRRFASPLLPVVLWKTGGMPSSHSALVTALATSIGFHDGADSSLFFLSVFYAAIIIRDAVGVRKAAGQQAQVLNRLGEGVREKLGVEFTPVKEVTHGHTFPEVGVGMVLGFSIALVVSLLS
ncbi:acid phosphatase/vanadium-dependent haloperoxidase related protein [Spirochaeta thermophila DSM 6578]|uniref:Acid phosphatase/vanadium-dependent haloperoxidase related protein n=1 Tax=Winmispira thermophila (strain ATCC 700085 / DSM 6578 / Z-1203) TaxID=869211 RepID=G0GF41_WINT7|nr:divergent PAP2 family protein [Spirochaeta thermophila]AEJ60740.1 acid phosphatase/vanadium-dependent haloperoxidase related protein [Spirochaeta thermophila DSM 6578]